MQGATIHTSEGLYVNIVSRNLAAPAALMDGFQPHRKNGNGATTVHPLDIDSITKSGHRSLSNGAACRKGTNGAVQQNGNGAVQHDTNGKVPANGATIVAEPEADEKQPAAL